jgi:hypothetical protein
VEGKNNIRSFHLAGIIPIGDRPRDFNFQWHDSLMPVGRNYTALENAVQECAMAGCETIWIVSHMDMQPLIRERIGDWIYDPVTVVSDYRKRAKEIREIPVYYVPVHPNDKDRRDCLSWSALYGVLSAFLVCAKISKWVIPDKYYISFPYGMIDLEVVRKSRSLITSKRNFYFKHDGNTVKDGSYLSFTIGGDDYLELRRKFREESINSYRDGGIYVPVDEQYNARYFTVKDVFKHLKQGKKDNYVDLDWYYYIGDWESYCNFLGSPERSHFVRREDFTYNEWNPIGEDNEEGSEVGPRDNTGDEDGEF